MFRRPKGANIWRSFLNGKAQCSFLRCSEPVARYSVTAQVSDILLVAYVTKTLSGSGTRNLDHNVIPLSESVVLEVLRRQHLKPAVKLEFFKWCSQVQTFQHSAATYSQILRVLSRSESIHETIDVIDSMKRNGVVASDEALQEVLNSMIRLGEFHLVLTLGHFDSAIAILSKFQELELALGIPMYDSIIVSLASKGHFELAFSLFLKLVERSNGSRESLPSNIACNTLLSSLKKANKKAEFQTVFDKLREKTQFEFDLRGYNISIHAFGCFGDLTSSLTLFKEMKTKPLHSPDICTYNTIIQVLCSSGKLPDALTIFQELKTSGLEPDAFTYRTLVLFCCKSYRINTALSLFHEMERRGHNPNTQTYNTLLDGLFKARKLIDACHLFEKMSWFGVRASTVTHNIIIDGLFRNGRVEAGYQLFLDLKNKGPFLDSISFNIVALQLSREGLLNEALDLVDEMQDRGLTVDLVILTTIFIEFHKQGRGDSSGSIMKRIRDSDLVAAFLNWRDDLQHKMTDRTGTPPDYSSIFPHDSELTHVVNSFPPSGSVEKPEPDLWSVSPHLDYLADQKCSTGFTMARGVRIEPEQVSSFESNMRNTFLSVFLCKGNLSFACKLFEIFKEFKSYGYNSIMSAFVKRGYFGKVADVFVEMGEKLTPPDIATWNVVIQGLGKMGMVDLARCVVDNLVKQGGYVDVVMYNTLIHALGKGGRLDECVKLFEEMVGAGINADVVTYNTLIEVHAKAGRLDDARRFLKMMVLAGCLPNHVTDTILDFLGKEMREKNKK